MQDGASRDVEAGGGPTTARMREPSARPRHPVWRAAIILVAFALGPIAACGSPAPSPTIPPASSPPPQVTVTLGIYSGRPDPSWELDEAQTAELLDTVYGLPVASGRLPEGGLGYRGFEVVVITPGTGEGRLVAYRGVVAGSGTGEVRLDSTRSVERFLLDSGRSRLGPAEIAAVEADLGNP